MYTTKKKKQPIDKYLRNSESVSRIWNKISGKLSIEITYESIFSPNYVLFGEFISPNTPKSSMF